MRPQRFAAAAATVLTGFLLCAAAPAPAPPHEPAGLAELTDLSAQRLATADRVAAAKWATGGPIDAPEREAEVISAAREAAAGLGSDPDAAARVMRDQMEANKQVQRALHRRWAADPGAAPAGPAPDLTPVRVTIDRLNAALVRALAGAAPVRATPACPVRLTAATAATRARYGLDALHTSALHGSVRSVCALSRPAS